RGMCLMALDGRVGSVGCKHCCLSFQRGEAETLQMANNNFLTRRNVSRHSGSRGHLITSWGHRHDSPAGGSSTVAFAAAAATARRATRSASSGSARSSRRSQ
ncbi:ubiquitin-conjugating enzyme E2 D4-like, partial [Arapaima gigas]